MAHSVYKSFGQGRQTKSRYKDWCRNLGYYYYKRYYLMNKIHKSQ